MKLIVDVQGDVPNNLLKGNTIILTKNPRRYGEKFSLVEIDYSICDSGVHTGGIVKNIFRQLPEPCAPLQNSAYMRVFRPLNSIIFQIQEILDANNIDQIILFGGQNSKYLTLNNGEGEGEKILYKSSWFFNSFVYDTFKDKVDILWLNKERYTGNFFFRFRENLFFFRLFKRYVILYLSQGKKNIYDQRNRVFSIVENQLQLEHFRNILSVKTYNSVLFFSSNPSLKDIHIRILPDIRDFLSAFFLFYKIKRNMGRKIKIVLGDKELFIPGDVLLRALKVNFIDFYSKKKMLGRVSQKFAVKPKCMITNMTFGDNLILANQIADENKLRHYNFQAVSMSRMLFPILKLADVYFLYSLKTQKFYEQYEKSYKFYFPVIHHMRRELKHPLVCTLFLQPDDYAEKYLSFLQCFIRSIGDLNIRLIVKPHYRQNRLNEFLKIINSKENIELAGKFSNVRSLIEDSDFVLSMTSSILFESIQVNVPGIILGLYKEDKRFYEASSFPEINFLVESIDELYEILKAPTEYRNEYYDRRERFLDQYESISVNEIFNEKNI